MLDINVILTVIIIAITVIIVIKKCCSKPETVTENFSDEKYLKVSETKVPFKNDAKKITGNLEQCQAECNLDKDCVGFVREKKADIVQAKCNIIKNIVNCHNEFKEPSENYTLSPGISSASDYYDYNTYLKLDVGPMDKDNIQKCVRLDQRIGFVPRRYPFSILLLDDNFNLKVVTTEKQVSSLEDVEDDKFYAKHTVFTIVKGLSGKGVSFKINKGNSDYYICIGREGENLSCLLEDNDVMFKRKATFLLDMEYAEDEQVGFDDVKFVSIKNETVGVTTYWKVDNVTHKVVLVNKDKLGKNLEDVMFQFSSPLNYTEPEEKNNTKKNNNNNNKNDSEVFPEPADSNSLDLENVTNMKNMTEELDRLELDIRETQHKQNLKLMNIMLDVNKFKLHDISMSGYLQKCLNPNSEKEATYIDKKITGEPGISGDTEDIIGPPQVSL